MKIAVIMTIPGDAGTQQAAALTAEALAVADHNVTLLLPDGAKSIVTKCCPDVKVVSISHYFPTLGPVRYLKQPLMALKLRKQFADCVADLKQHLSVEQFDVLLAVHPTAFQAARSATDGSIPIAAMMSRIDSSHVRQMRKADAFIVTTDEMQDFAVKNGIRKERCHVLPHCVSDPGQVQPTRIRQPVRLGGMARLQPNKGMAMFVRALNLLESRNICFSATIAGTGQERDKLISMCRLRGLQDKVQFPGWLDGDTKEAFFRSIDILVQPAWRDSFGIVLVEAMARGLPVISGNTVGARYIITNELDGLIFKPHEPAVLADCIERIIQDREKRVQLGKNARMTFEKRFTTEVIGRRAASILERVVVETKRA